jgi:prepilin-type N-terminal cleavage/methylation domain-containing protein
MPCYKSNRSRGFTLVELLVVISIIGMLAALILPALYSSLSNGRRSDCENKLRQLGIAATSFEARKGYLPGYINPKLHASATQNPSWQLVLLNDLDRQSVYKSWVDYATGDSPFLGFLVCKDDNTALGVGGPKTSYVVNTGKPGHAVIANIANPLHDGLCHDLSNSVTARQRRISLNQITDGASVTVLASENLDADEYISTANDPEDLYGISWGGPQFLANQKSGERTAFTTPDFRYARPSSGHTSSFNVVFAGGNARSLDQDIDPLVWNALLTPNGRLVEPVKQKIPLSEDF